MNCQKIQSFLLHSHLLTLLEISQVLAIYPEILGAMEIDYNNLDIGEQIAQGGFSVILNGKFRGTKVAIKKIFDPVITDELLGEMKNEI
jgi:predicted Ser/Thr protein kinase